jgi:hypothetical protein
MEFWHEAGSGLFLSSVIVRAICGSRILKSGAPPPRRSTGVRAMKIY